MKPVRRLPQVDSLRALAALSVAFLHAMVAAGLLYRHGVAGQIVGQLDVAVALFFCISGYVLYRPFVRSHLAGGAPSTGAYAIRRILRIGPAYWVALTIGALVLGWSYVFTPTGFVNYFGFLYLYGDNPLSAINPAWSLCVEITFYVFLPGWAWALRRAPAQGREGVLRLHLVALGGLMAASGLYTLSVLQFGGLGNVNPAGTWEVSALPANLSYFAIGMIVAVLSIKWADGASAPPAARWIRTHPGVPLAAAAFLFAMAVVFVTQDYAAPVLSNGVVNYYGHQDYVIRTVMFWGIGALVLFPAVFPHEGAVVDRALKARWLAGLGLVSYGMYLWHWPLLLVLLGHTNLRLHTGQDRYLEWALLTVAGTIVLGVLSYLIVERPAMNWANRLTRGDRRDPRGGGNPARPPVVEPESS